MIGLISQVKISRIGRVHRSNGALSKWAWTTRPKSLDLTAEPFPRRRLGRTDYPDDIKPWQ